MQHMHNGVISHQIVNIRHIPGHINLVGDGISRRDEDQPHTDSDGSSWSVELDWENARGLEYDLFSVGLTHSNTHDDLHTRFSDER
jgi:hypothetical protein